MFLLSRWFIWIDSPLSGFAEIRPRLRMLELEKTDDGDELIMPQGKTGDPSIESIPFQADPIAEANDKDSLYDQA
ncbi:hypothetical protein Q3G72_018873 [Acer saccharum]|nr:hypothetical protein Q3G72_018873 [Acer saccharum]